MPRNPVLVFLPIPYDGSTLLCPCCQEQDRLDDPKTVCAICDEICPNAPYQCACGRWFDGR